MCCSLKVAYLNSTTLGLNVAWHTWFYSYMRGHNNYIEFSLKCCSLEPTQSLTWCLCKFHYIFKGTLTAVAEGWRQTEQDLCVFKGCWQQGEMHNIFKRMNCQLLLLQDPGAIQQFTSKISDSNCYAGLFPCLSHLWIECGNKLPDLLYSRSRCLLQTTMISQKENMALDWK